MTKNTKKLMAALFLIALCTTVLFILAFKLKEKEQEIQAMDFRSAQKQYSRVREAYADCKTNIEAHLKNKSLRLEGIEIVLCAYKEEQILELWGRNKKTKKFQHLEDFQICRSSGVLGPKRQKGDMQVPEGLYHVDRFNPKSNFHLSLGTNYPNASDKILSQAKKLGGDIFIHGSCVTIGCIPIKDEPIKRLYVYAVEAKQAGHQIPVYIFPFKSENANIEQRTGEHIKLWKNLLEMQQYFDTHKQIIPFKVNQEGYYQLIQ
ncbi:MAG: L,D-transpeptidase family protein [Bernardetiaceae bacterium]|nr:L,D-transpeptidase family protein [Bernardetiaceae bacterium]